MVVRRSSSVAAQARAAARTRRSAVLQQRREREQKVAELADQHAVAVAVAVEIRERAEREAAMHLAEADSAVLGLLKLGESVDDVAALLDVPAQAVRVVRRRSRARSADAGGMAVSGPDERISTDSPVRATHDDRLEERAASEV